MRRIRELLNAAFTAKQLRRFCFDDPVLRPIVDEFAPDHGLSDLVDHVLEYCEKNLLLEHLLDGVNRENPGQYARFIEPELPEDKPPPLTPELLTISRPISLHLVRIPAGEFQMGSVMARDKDAQEDELPPHRVHVPEFYIGQYPVTNRQYQAFVDATGHRAPDHWEEGEISRGKRNHPVVYVAWRDAVAFCDWLSQETKQPFRLLSEAQWERAARGPDRRIYPWGDDPPDEDRCNFGHDLDSGDTTTIGRYSPQGDSPYGCADMAGNVWEWCRSLYEPYPYQADDGREDLKASGIRVLRGGAYWTTAEYVRCAYRYRTRPGRRYSYVGFRVARGPLG